MQQVCNLPLVDEKLPALHVASKLGYYEIVKSLLEICNVNSLDTEYFTALHHAQNPMLAGLEAGKPDASSLQPASYLHAQAAMHRPPQMLNC